MSKNKSIFVTLVMAVMLALILVGAYRIEEKAFFGILAALAGYGFLRGAGDLCRWMQAEPKPVETVEAEQVDPDDPFAYDDEFADEFAGSAPFIFGGLRFHDGTFEEAGK